MHSKYQSLRLILGDQLNAGHSWFSYKDESVLYVVAELKQEADYVKHHIQKICAFFLAMQGFAQALEAAGHHVLHLTLDDSCEYKDLPELLNALCEKFQVQQLSYQRPDEYRLAEQLRTISLPESVQLEEVDTEHFLLDYEEIPKKIKPAQHNRMESFYRDMRRHFNILMEDNQPVGGQWNYDKENRQKLKAADLADIPKPLVFANDVRAILERINRHQIVYFGKAEECILWPVSRSQCLQLLNFFCEQCLPQFGRFQDAMTDQSPHQWSLYHSRLSFALNSKMLHPMQVIQAALQAFERAKGAISLAQVEGFIRQILGWREFVRAVYWANMPEYTTLNHLEANQPLPDFFWTADTRMNCMKQAIGQSLDYAYAHHIQRLMVTGNFCLLTGIDPQQVDDWYLGIYIDALEWVEMPNTRGMSQFADGGIVATKPYSAGGNYINKMSDYCKNCHYDIKQKASEEACPFNSLYWGFMVKYRHRFSTNHRIGMIYKNWDKQSEESRQAILQRAKWCREHSDQL